MTSGDDGNGRVAFAVLKRDLDYLKEEAREQKAARSKNDDDHAEIKADIGALRVEMTAVKVRSGFWGALAGLAAGLGGALISWAMRGG